MPLARRSWHVAASRVCSSRVILWSRWLRALVTRHALIAVRSCPRLVPHAATSGNE
jgi:hypothetical protein